MKNIKKEEKELNNLLYKIKSEIINKIFFVSLNTRTQKKDIYFYCGENIIYLQIFEGYDLFSCSFLSTTKEKNYNIYCFIKDKTSINCGWGESFINPIFKNKKLIMMFIGDFGEEKVIKFYLDFNELDIIKYCYEEFKILVNDLLDETINNNQYELDEKKSFYNLILKKAEDW